MARDGQGSKDVRGGKVAVKPVGELQSTDGKDEVELDNPGGSSMTLTPVSELRGSDAKRNTFGKLISLRVFECLLWLPPHSIQRIYI